MSLPGPGPLPHWQEGRAVGGAEWPPAERDVKIFDQLCCLTVNIQTTGAVGFGKSDLAANSLQSPPILPALLISVSFKGSLVLYTSVTGRATALHWQY